MGRRWKAISTIKSYAESNYRFGVKQRRRWPMETSQTVSSRSREHTYPLPRIYVFCFHICHTLLNHYIPVYYCDSSVSNSLSLLHHRLVNQFFSSKSIVLPALWLSCTFFFCSVIVFVWQMWQQKNINSWVYTRAQGPPTRRNNLWITHRHDSSIQRTLPKFKANHRRFPLLST